MSIEVFNTANQMFAEFEADFIPPLNSFLHFGNGVFEQVTRVVIPVPAQKGTTASVVQVVVQPAQ